jgi:recombination protein RecA
VAAFVDAEHALDPDRAKAVGVKIDKLLSRNQIQASKRSTSSKHLSAQFAVDIIVIDSVAALTPRAELEGEMGDSHMGLHARLMSQGMRKLTAIISKSRSTVIFINQIRMKIGVMFGNPETTTGGQALKFYSSVRIEIRRMAQIKQGEAIVGNRVKAKVVKNKVAAPFKQQSSTLCSRKAASLIPEILLDTGATLQRRNQKPATPSSLVKQSLGLAARMPKSSSRQSKVGKDIEKALRIKSKEVIWVKHPQLNLKYEPQPFGGFLFIQNEFFETKKMQARQGIKIKFPNKNQNFYKNLMLPELTRLDFFAIISSEH